MKLFIVQFLPICFFLPLRLVIVLITMFAYTFSHVLSITLNTKYGTRIKQHTKLNFEYFIICGFKYHRGMEKILDRTEVDLPQSPEKGSIQIRGIV
jgi:hypothetical protein